MLKKPLIIASTAAVLLGSATLSTQAKAGDPIFGALVGGALGATIGHAVDGRHGAGVGAAIGAFAGAASSASHGGYYGDGGYYGGGYYAPAAPRYYAPTYAPAPVYGYGYGYAPVYPSATIVYSSGSRHYGHRHRNHYRDGYGYRGYR